MANARINFSTPSRNNENTPMALKARQPETMRKAALGDIKNYISTPSAAEVKNTNRPQFRTPMPIKKNMQNDIDEVSAFEQQLMPAEDQISCIDFVAFEQFLNSLAAATLRDCPSPPLPPPVDEPLLHMEFETLRPSSPPIPPQIELPPFSDDENESYLDKKDEAGDHPLPEAPLNHSVLSLNGTFDMDVNGDDFRPMLF